MRTLTRAALTGAATVALAFTASPALAAPDRPRPSPPPEPRGLYQSGQIECIATYPDGPTAPPVIVCSDDSRPEEAAFPQTGPANRENSPNF
jgi:hypothetical protein